MADQWRDEDVDALLARTRPVVSDDENERTAARLWSLRDQGRRRRNASKRWFAFGGIATIILGGLAAGPAVADHLAFMAQTGFVPDEGSETAPSSEAINLDAEDFDSYAYELWHSKYSLPDGYASQAVFDGFLAQLQRETGEVPWDGERLTQSINVDRIFETGTRCLWIKEWLEADEGSPDQNRAQAVLEESLEWTWTAWLLDIENEVGQKIASQMRSGDPGQLEEAFELDWCHLYLESVETASDD